MAEVWQMTRAQFVGSWVVDDSDANDLDLTFGYECDELTADWNRRSLREVAGHEGFFFADIKGQPCDIALLERDDFDGTYDVVGYYCGGHIWNNEDGGQLWLADGVRGRGLSAELILEKASVVGGPICNRSYTAAGKAAQESAHRLAVQRAMREGYRVPAHVMADYPEFEFGMPAPVEHAAPAMAY